MFIPALIISLRRSTERDAGPGTREPTKKVLPNLTAKPIYNIGETPPTQESFEVPLLHKRVLPTPTSIHTLEEAACGVSNLSQALGTFVNK